MSRNKRFDIFTEQHIGVGIWWRRNVYFDLEVGVALPFMVISMGFGRKL